MKCTIPEISWHNRDPVLSVDIQPKPLEGDNKNIIRLASGGSDAHVLIWYITYDDGAAQLEIASDLSRHQRAVNVVRWSPSGEFLASGDDESIIFIWQLKDEKEPLNILDDEGEQDRETWLIYKTLRGHLEDVYDISWSLDSLRLVSGSVDNTAIIWDMKKGKSQALFNDHKGFVQGVAWDPRSKYVATLATDRCLRLFDVNTHKVARRINKSTYPVDESSPLHGKTIRLFHDDTLATFYRRFCFSPDGQLIIVPTGCTDIVASNNDGAAQNSASKQNDVETQSNDENRNDLDKEGNAVEKLASVEKPEANEKPNKLLNTSYIFSRYSMKKPAVVIPSPDHFTIAIRCCPLLFELRPHDEDKPPLVDLPYRMIYAVASKSSVYLYDTQQKIPFGCISNIHYARLTDLTWSSDGNILIVSSVDGFCTVITFEDGELGTVYDKPFSLEDIDEKDNLARKRPSPKSTGKSKRIAESEMGETFNVEPIKATNADNPKRVIVELPETLISSAETFESPEYKEKQATPIAIRREPRTNPSTPAGSTPKTNEKQQLSATTSARKAKPIATRRQPRSILTSSITIVDKSSADQDEALDSWPIPIDTLQKSEHSAFKYVGKEPPAKKIEKSSMVILSGGDTQDLKLVYDGDSESMKPTISVELNDNVEENKAEDAATTTPSDQAETSDSKNQKTPRRVQLRTISTPKSKKKLNN